MRHSEGAEATEESPIPPCVIQRERKRPKNPPQTAGCFATLNMTDMGETEGCFATLNMTLRYADV